MGKLTPGAFGLAQLLNELTGDFTLAENALQGAVAGTLSGVTSGSTLTLVNDAGGAVQLVGSAIQAGPLGYDWESEQQYTFVVREQLGADFREHTLTLNITNVFEAATLGTITGGPTFTASESVAAATVFGTLGGKTAGSTLWSPNTAGGRIQVWGNEIRRGSTPLDWATAPDLGNGQRGWTFTVRETLEDSPNSPQTYTYTLYVTQAAVAPSFAMPTATVGSPYSHQVANLSGASVTLDSATVAQLNEHGLTHNGLGQFTSSNVLAEAGPTITSGALTGAYTEGTVINFTTTASEPVTWSASGETTGLTLNPTTGVGSYTVPAHGADTDRAFTITATDGIGLTATQPNTITITAIATGPALDLTLTSALDPMVTFSRATGGTVIGATGTVNGIADSLPRFDHTFGSGTPRGLLIEEARTNVLKYSISLSQAYWTYSGATLPIVTPDYAIGPDGTMSATRVQGTIGSSFVQRTSVAGADQIKSVWARLPDDWPTATATTYLCGRSGTVKYLVTLTKTWQRFSFPVVTTETNGTNFIVVDFRNGSTTATDVLLWGAQLTVGAFPTSTIKTFADTVSRAEDRAYLDGSNFSSWWNASEGTFVIEASGIGSGQRVVFETSDGTTTNLVRLWLDGLTLKLTTVAAGVARPDLTVGTVTADVAFKAAVALKANDVAVVLNGGTVQTDTAAVIPVQNVLTLGYGTALAHLCGHLKSVKFYAQRRTNAAMQGDTT